MVLLRNSSDTMRSQHELRRKSRRKARMTLSSLYETPLLIHLIESRRWEAAEKKLVGIFTELRNGSSFTKDHLLEVYYMCCMSYSYAARLQGRRIGSVIDADMLKALDIHRLERWALDTLKQLMEQKESTQFSHTFEIVSDVQSIIQQFLHEDISLQSLSNKVHLHPKYLSWLYKHETGENVSEYVNRLRMEKAAHWLKHSEKKVYEIAERLGYQNTSYFIRVFKDKFQMTPQQYREHSIE